MHPMSTPRALLLTDVVDSTKLTEALGDAAMGELWVAHDRAARDLLPAWRGREIDKTDGMLVLFDSAADAVGYALAYHRAIGTISAPGLPFTARAGIHVGPVTLRANTADDIARGAKPVEVDGLALPVAARVMSIALGRQTLLSTEARQALGAAPQRVQSHGHWRLHGVADPVELFEIGDADAPFAPPPDAAKAYRVVREGDVWLPARNIRHSLPAERDAFVGRHETLLELARHLDAGARLVSVLGIGGTGKTRLVTRFGWSWLGDFPGGVWFCDLSQTRSPDDIVNAVAQGLDVPLGKEDPVTQIGNAIAGRGPCLMILDNFEQVARYAEATLGRWLNRAGNAQFLITTREVLGLKGEAVLAVSPLQPSDAATLFLARAKAANPDFQPTAEDRSAITRLVALLDCLPLAIELAAARIRVMPTRMLLSRMSDRFKLLSSTGLRQDRQATLRAVFDWSWDLLPLAEKTALAQLSVFEGGFTLESVEAVVDLSAYPDAPWPMDALQSIVQKSFVRQVSDARFDLLVSVKEYASEHLRTEGRYAGSGSAARRAAEVRHGAYFAGLDETFATANRGIELDNFVAACRRAAARGNANVAASALACAWVILRFRGPFSVGVELASVVRDIADLGAQAIALVEWVAGSAMAACGNDRDAYVHFEASLRSARRIEDRRRECHALIGMGDRDTLAGRAEIAHSHLASALTIAREISDPNLESRTENGLGNLEEAQGRLEEAVTHYETALNLARHIGDKDLEGSILGNLGSAFQSQGSMESGRNHMQAALAVAQGTGNRRLEGNTLCNLGLQFQFAGRLEEALGHLGASLVVARDLGSRLLESIVLCNLGMTYASLTRIDEARDHFEASLVVARELGDQRSEGQFVGYLGLLHARQSRFDEARRCLSTGEALLRAVSDRLSLGILLCSRAESEHLAGDPESAKAAHAQAQTIADGIGAGPDSELGLALLRVRNLFSHSGSQ